MTAIRKTARGELRLLVFAALLTCLPLVAAAASAQGHAAHMDPDEIDRAVREFTGVPAGETGGARAPADPRLRLARCGGPLQVEWHGEARTSLRVACPGPRSWRIFIAARAAESGPATAPQVARGDPITVIVRGHGFSVQQGGEAMEAGRIGEWIAVRTARDASPVRARIERPGLAVIPAR